jgi:hypothetical protein
LFWEYKKGICDTVSQTPLNKEYRRNSIANPSLY